MTFFCALSPTPTKGRPGKGLTLVTRQRDLRTAS